MTDKAGTCDEAAATLEPVPPLRLLRRLRGWTQTELAAAAGVSLDTISDLERGAREAHPSTMIKIAKALGVAIRSVDEFTVLRPRPARPPDQPPPP